MDPLTVSAVATVLNRFLGETAVEAGKSTWAGLVGLVRAAFPGHAAAEAVTEAAERLTPGTAPDQNAVIDLSAELVGLAKSNTGFESALRKWMGEAGSLAIDGGVTTNTIGEGATIHGNVVQGRDIGPVTFGR